MDTPKEQPSGDIEYTWDLDRAKTYCIEAANEGRDPGEVLNWIVDFGETEYEDGNMFYHVYEEWFLGDEEKYGGKQ